MSQTLKVLIPHEVYKYPLVSHLTRRLLLRHEAYYKSTLFISSLISHINKFLKGGRVEAVHLHTEFGKTLQSCCY